MNFSVIIPAFNAADTLSATLDSLVAQTFGHWQAIIIDDGSSDDTSEIAKAYCNKDARFRLIKQSNAGLSMARNAGIKEAEHDHLFFLDADDWIAPEYFEKFSREFENDPGIDAVVCGWQFMLEDGSEADIRFPPASDDMFPYLSHTCPFVVHACVIHRRLIDNIGMFDSSVGYVEDWDFWQRASRAGAKFKLIREVLAFYRMRKGSLSRKVYQSYKDARQMIFKGYAEDKRVNLPLEKYRLGMPDDKMDEHLCWIYCWYAALCIGTGESIRGLEEPHMKSFEPDPRQLATFVFEGVYRGGCFRPELWLDFYQKNQKQVEELFELLQSRVLLTSVVRESRLELYSMIARRIKEDNEQMIGEVLYLPLDLSRSLGDVITPATRIIVDARLNGESLGMVEFSNETGRVAVMQLKKKISEEWAWPIMTNYLKCRHPELTASEIDGGKGWELFLQELWGLDWPEATFYDYTHVDNYAYDTVACGGEVGVDIGKRLFHIRPEGKELRIEYGIGDLVIGQVVLPVDQPIISAQAIRAAISVDGKFELCKAAVTQGLIGKKAEMVILRDTMGKF